MKNTLKITSLIAFVIILFSCNEAKKLELPEGFKYAIVLENIDTEQYSYFRVDEQGKEYWLAANIIKAKKGDTIYFSQSMVMKNFESKSLNRTFDEIYFIGDASTTAPGQVAEDRPHPKVDVDRNSDISVEKAEGGYTVFQINDKKYDLKGQVVRVRGKVVKYNEEIMGKNWIHIQDGTGRSSSYDLLVTTGDITKVGDIIEIEGTVAVDKDFGSGYKYEVLVEDAKILNIKGQSI